MNLIVFDLDFTLWNAGGTWIDHTYPPFTRKNGFVYDSRGSRLFLYPETVSILEKLKEDNNLLAIASRTHKPEWALNLMKLYNIGKYFDFLEIYPGSKIEHFYQLQHQTGITFENMIFFDDELRNVDEVGSLGVKTVLVNQGINMEIVTSNI